LGQDHPGKIIRASQVQKEFCMFSIRQHAALPRVGREGAHRQQAELERRADPGGGELPVWNLDDLYSAMDAPEIERDLVGAERRRQRSKPRARAG
jgi:hypothetical protein